MRKQPITEEQERGYQESRRASSVFNRHAKEVLFGGLPDPNIEDVPPRQV
jgi:hypothetical protein